LLSLSLFIMLLAFFIVLNTISSYEEEKVKPVLDSIGATFASKVTEFGNDLPSVTASVEKSLHEGSTLDKLESLFVAQIPAHKAQLNQSSGTMHVELSFDDFERAVIALGGGTRKETPDNVEAAELLEGFFLPALVALMNNNNTGYPYRMDVLVTMDENPALIENQNPQRMITVVKRISRVAQQIEQGGLPEKLMTVGIKQGKAGNVELFFRPHIPYNPLGEGEVP